MSSKNISHPHYIQLIGDTLKRIRLSKDITQSDLAAESGLSQANIVQYENPTRYNRDLMLDNLVSICKALGVSLGELASEAEGYEPAATMWITKIAGKRPSEEQLQQIEAVIRAIIR